MSFWEEIKRRKVVRVAVAYSVVAWLLVEIVVTVEAPLNLPGWMDTFVIVLVVIGFPLALILSWAYDLTPTGIERTKHLESSDQISQESTAAMPQEQESPLNVLPYSLAVLPFANMSDDPEQEYFSDGLTDDIITDLSLIPGLFVIARNSTFTYKGKSVDVRRLGQEMGVRYVLEGSVRKSSNQVRVTAQLIEAASGHHLWAKRYDRSLEDVFAVQDALTKEIVTALDVELVSGEKGRHQRSRVKNPEAREALYRGMAQFYKFDETSHAQAKMFFEQVTRLEPDSILGYVWQAQMCQIEIFFGRSEDKGSSLKNMEVFIEKALKIDDRDPLALGHAGMHQLFLGNHDQSIAFAKQALAEAPGMDSPYYSLGWFQMFNETPLEGIENLKRAMRLSPIVTAPRSTILGTAYRNAGQLELAVATLENTVNRFPAFISGRVALASCYALMCKEQEAKQEAREILRRDPAYTIARYTTPNLYRNKETMEKWAESLRKAGIPD
ncbi:MAG: tetratricopeptide repeat protein [Pseudomonadota bacterium]